MTIPDTMQAARLTRHGGPEALELATVPVPSPLASLTMVSMRIAPRSPPTPCNG